MRTKLGLLAAAAGLLLGLAPATGATLDPLHLCYSGGCGGFNGVTASGSSQNLSGWGVSSSPAGDSGELSIVVLVPQNETFTGTLTGAPNPQGMQSAFTISAFTNVGTFGSGQDLALNVLNLTLANGSPKNPFTAYSAASLALDPGFTSYAVWEATITNPNPFSTGTQAGQTSDLNNLFSLSQAPDGAIVTAFLNEGSSGTVSTAQSSALALSGTPLSVTPLPTSIVFMLTGLLGLIGIGRKWAIPLA